MGTENQEPRTLLSGTVPEDEVFAPDSVAGLRRLLYRAGKERDEAQVDLRTARAQRDGAQKLSSLTLENLGAVEASRNEEVQEAIAEIESLRAQLTEERMQNNTVLDTGVPVPGFVVLLGISMMAEWVSHQVVIRGRCVRAELRVHAPENRRKSYVVVREDEDSLTQHLHEELLPAVLHFEALKLEAQQNAQNPETD